MFFFKRLGLPSQIFGSLYGVLFSREPQTRIYHGLVSKEPLYVGEWCEDSRGVKASVRLSSISSDLDSREVFVKSHFNLKIANIRFSRPFEASLAPQTRESLSSWRKGVLEKEGFKTRFFKRVETQALCSSSTRSSRRIPTHSATARAQRLSPTGDEWRIPTLVSESVCT